jgi:hypothetical protein
MKARNQPVKVVWHDAVNGQGWEGLDRIVAGAVPEKIESVGFLVYKDKQRIVLTTSIGGDEGLGWVVIPAPWIVEVRALTVGETKKKTRRKAEAEIYQVPAEQA